MRSFKVYSLGIVEIYNRVIMLYILSPEIIYLINWKFAPWTTFTSHLHHPAPTSGNPQSVLCFYEFLFLLDLYITEVIQHLCFSDLFSIMPSKSSHAVEMQDFLFYGGMIVHSIYELHFLYLFISWTDVLAIVNNAMTAFWEGDLFP